MLEPAWEVFSRLSWQPPHLTLARLLGQYLEGARLHDLAIEAQFQAVGPGRPARTEPFRNNDPPVLLSSPEKFHRRLSLGTPDSLRATVPNGVNDIVSLQAFAMKHGGNLADPSRELGAGADGGSVRRDIPGEHDRPKPGYGHHLKGARLYHRAIEAQLQTVRPQGPGG